VLGATKARVRVILLQYLAGRVYMYSSKGEVKTTVDTWVLRTRSIKASQERHCEAERENLLMLKLVCRLGFEFPPTFDSFDSKIQSQSSARHNGARVGPSFGDFCPLFPATLRPLELL